MHATRRYFNGDASLIWSTQTTGASEPMDIGRVIFWSVVFLYSDNAGTVKVQVSPDTETWTDLPGSSQVISASGSHTVNYSGSGHKYLRASYAHSSGTGTVEVYLTGK